MTYTLRLGVSETMVSQILAKNPCQGIPHSQKDPNEYFDFATSVRNIRAQAVAYEEFKWPTCAS